jgi:hypothetical protein
MAKVGYSLESIVAHSLRVKGVRKSDLSPGDRVFIKTCNSLYEILVLGNGKYSVSGGWFDKKGLSPRKIGITGCTWSGSAVKVDIVAACGLCLEFENRLITSTIQKVMLLPFGWQN